jgi:hypothetical protein
MTLRGPDTQLFVGQKLEEAVDVCGSISRCATLLRVIHAVRGDAEVGEDSAMYDAMGYTAKGRRRKPGPKKKASASPAP